MWRGSAIVILEIVAERFAARALSCHLVADRAITCWKNSKNLHCEEM
jgi:hypothetical protein